MAVKDSDVEKINRMSEKEIINGAESVDLYSFFGVDWKANAAEIRSAYRALTLQYDPDRHAGDASCEQKFQAINKVNEILSKEDKRKKYHEFYECYINTSAGFASLSGEGVDWASYNAPDPNNPDPSTRENPEPPTPDNPEPPTPDNPEPPTPDNPTEGQALFESNAYGGFEFNNLHKDKKKNLIPKGGLDAKPVDFKRTEKLELKGDDIMKDLWRLWMHIWKLCLGKTVDWSLDLLNFGIYEPFQKHKLANQAKELEKKDARYYGDKLYENYSKKAMKNAGLFQKSFDEIMTNIDNRKAGLPETWRTWRQEPNFFERLVQIEARATADPNSNEAKFWEKFKTTPEIAKNMFEKEVDLRYLSIHIAALDEGINNPDEYKLPEDVSKKIKEMETILHNETDAQKIKDKIKEKVTELRPQVTGTDYVNQKITEKLDKMERVVIGPETDAQALKNSFRKSIGEIKEINPVSQRIEDASKLIYDNLMQNIEKIAVTYANDQEAMTTNIRGYMTHMFTAVYDLEKTSKDFFEHREDITEKIKEKTGRGTTYKKTANEKLTTAKEAIDNFVFNGREVGSIRRPATVRHNPIAEDRTQVQEFIKNVATERRP